MPRTWMQPPALLLAALLLALAAPPARAQHAHEEPVLDTPKTLAEGLRRIDDERAKLEAALKGPRLEAADAPAYTLSELLKSIGRVALSDPAVPKDRVKTINLIGRQAGLEAAAVHEGVEASRAQEALMHLANMQKLLESLKKAAAGDTAGTTAAARETFICEMHCEGTKQYDAPGTCPVCKMDLTPLSKAGYFAKVTALNATGGVEAGRPTTLEIRLLQPSGEPLDQVQTVHEHPLHFMLMSDDLSFYSQQHPTRREGGTDGAFVLEKVVFPFGGKFIAWSDFTPAAAGAGNQHTKFEFKVRDGAAPLHEPLKLTPNADAVGKDGDYEFRVRCNGADPAAGQDTFLRYAVDLKGQPVTDLQTLMGARGHLVIVSSDHKHYLHAHPLDLNATDDDHKHATDAHAGHAHDHAHDDALIRKARAAMPGNGKPSDIVFHVVFPEPGLYRAFAQFQHKGKVLTYPVTFDVKPSPGGASPADAAPTHDHGHDGAPKPPAGGGK